MNNIRLLQYHSWLGLLTGAFLLLAGLTGSVLVFNEDMDRALFKKYETSAAPGTVHIDQAVRTIQHAFPAWETRLVHFRKGETFLFNLRRPEARRYVFVHPQTGVILANIDANTQLTKWLLKLHYSLHAGTAGRIVVFIVGILFFLSLITGIVLYRRVILKTLLFRVKVRRKHKRNLYSALHRYVGVWALFFNLILVITGIVLAYGVVKAGLQTPAAPDPPVVSASIERSLRLIAEKYPDFSPTYIRLPKQKSANITVNGKFKDDPFYLSEFYNKIQVDHKTGNIVNVIRIRDASFGTKLTSMAAPLHYGQFGGIWIKLLYCLIGLSGPFLSVAGFVIWRKRSA